MNKYQTSILIRKNKLNRLNKKRCVYCYVVYRRNKLRNLCKVFKRHKKVQG